MEKALQPNSETALIPPLISLMRSLQPLTLSPPIFLSSQLINRDLETSPCLTCDDLQGSSPKTLSIALNEISSSARQGCNACVVLYNSYLHIKDRSQGDISDEALDVTFQIPTLDAGYPLGLACLDGDGGYSWNELFTEVQAPRSPWLMIGQADERKKSARDAISVLKAWIETCQSSHPGCAMQSTRLPTRVLDVFGDRICLHIPEIKDEPYAALSHCWGKSPVIQTHRSTFEARILDIPWNDLPKTFQDAVTTTRLLGLKYLWIDSLCIIQDDAEDWTRESSNMASIYENAQIVIAASDSIDGSPGFLHDRLPAPASNAIYKGVSSGREPYEIKIREGDDHRWYGNLLPPRSQIVRDSSQLFTRGWAFQERILATRYVQFRSQELIWECKTSLWCECGTLSRPSQLREPASKHAFYQSLQSHDQSVIHSLWSRIVNTYASKALTNGNDILPALSGLAKRFQGSAAGEYLAGLWRQDLPVSLLWEAHGTRATPYRAPSWSWASIDTSTAGSSLIAESTFDSKASAPTESLATVNDVFCESSMADPTGRVSAGHLTITGQVLEIVALSRKETSRHGYESPFDWAARLSQNSAMTKSTFGFHADTIIPDLHREDLICILIAKIVAAPRALVLRKATSKYPETLLQKPILYERVGLIDRIILGSGVRSSGWWNIFRDAPVRTVTII
ncbi:hypothetical protein VTL71DRAFT_10703 [Oculimacula yallundae]|uniref:Heterokaryon incompatibility domain-containing protein n=1 Tax=Oculimacula yallundae TaxID=86028 RepID=A0ABR4CTZ9_9HELO